MPRNYSRQANRLRPVNSIKHVVDAETTVIGATVSTIPLIDTDDLPTLANVSEVLTGSTVGSIYLKVEVQSAATGFQGVPRIYFAVQKSPGNNIAATNPSSVGDSDVKKYVIHQEMTMVGEITSTTQPPSRTMFQGVIMIPRGYRRNGPDDRLQLNFAHNSGEGTGTTRVCVQCIYKEYR